MSENATPARPPLPPPGPTLSFSTWVQHVHREIAVYVPDVTPSGNKQTVRITRGSVAMRVVPDGGVWWVYFDQPGQTGRPTLCVERHDTFTAHNVAHTAIGIFDPTQSTVNKKPAKAPAAKPDAHE